jgi:hypothetical protein
MEFGARGSQELAQSVNGVPDVMFVIKAATTMLSVESVRLALAGECPGIGNLHQR